MTVERNPDHELQQLINSAYPSDVEGIDQPWGNGGDEKKFANTT